MMDKRKCLHCNHHQVYVEHIVKDEKLRFFCRHCGKTTGYFSTHDEAEKEWERMEVEDHSLCTVSDLEEME